MMLITIPIPIMKTIIVIMAKGVPRKKKPEDILREIEKGLEGSK
ncbi:hypothetical protein OMAG_002660, partial [Candidatus Omnitrophus magneticus]